MFLKISLTLLLVFTVPPMTTLVAAEGSSHVAQRILAEAEPRIRAIYERREFRPAEFVAEWMPDSSGYWIQKRDPKTNEPRKVFYDVRSGTPVRKTSANEPPQSRHPSVSPDGAWRLEARDHNLSLIETAGDRATPLTENAAGRAVSYRDFNWNREGTHAVFVEADATDVRQPPQLQMT